jgi:hypothetical protein
VHSSQQFPVPGWRQKAAIEPQLSGRNYRDATIDRRLPRAATIQARLGLETKKLCGVSTVFRQLPPKPVPLFRKDGGIFLFFYWFWIGNSGEFNAR